MESQKLLLVKACLIGDGSLTRITRDGRNTTMFSLTHCQQQKLWLEAKAKKLNHELGRNCIVGESNVFDKRTGRTYQSCQYSVTSVAFNHLYEIVYPGNRKSFKAGWLNGLTNEHLAIAWADDGNLEPKDRIGRLNVYQSKEECQIVADWIESICGAKGRYEDYENNGFGRLRFPASEMVKIAIAIKPYIHPTMTYKINMQYKRNTGNRLLLSASSPNDFPKVEEIPSIDELSAKEWFALAKKIGVPRYKEGTKEIVRQRIIETLLKVNGQ